MKILHKLKTTFKDQYSFGERTLEILTYVVEKRFLFWKYYRIVQVLPDLKKPVFDHEHSTITNIRLVAQRDYQQMWEKLVEYKNTLK